MSDAVSAENADHKYDQNFHVSTIPGVRQLEGIVIADRWRLEQLQHEQKQQTGGNFGVGYYGLDLKTNRECFVKVVDFRSRLTDLRQLQQLLNLATFEVEMHQYCIKMSRVVRMFAHGQLNFSTDAGADYQFLYLILEKGEGDIKNHVDFEPNKSPHWKLCVMKDVSLGAAQIERANLAHNDIKPSNVIRFKSSGDQHNIKLGDIGRIVTKSGSGPYDRTAWAGDPNHKPIEIVYGWIESDFQNRHTSADAYMLGNLLTFLFSGVSLTERIVNSLPPEYRPGAYKGMYRDIIDLIRHCWASIIKEQVEPCFPENFRVELSRLLQALTDPDPQVRGDTNARKRGLVGLDGIYSHFERICKRAAIEERIKISRK